MKFIKMPLKDAYLIKPDPTLDERGFFERLFCQKEFKKIGFKKTIVQINCSFTRKKGTIRGMHYQKPPHIEGKIISCLEGEVFDCIIDLRQKSSTFLKWHGEVLSAKNHKMIYIPEGFAHGFQTLRDNCCMLYLHTDFYHKQSEEGIKYDDPLFNIRWPQKIIDISIKDRNLSYLSQKFKGLKL